MSPSKIHFNNVLVPVHLIHRTVWAKNKLYKKLNIVKLKLTYSQIHQRTNTKIVEVW